MREKLSMAAAQELAQKHGLTRIDTPKPFAEYLRSVWAYRVFTYQYAVARIISSTARNRLGLLWEFLNPLLSAGMYYVAFGLLLGTKKDSPNFILFLIAGLFTWHQFNQSFNSTAKSLLQSRQLIENNVFPRAVVPLSAGLQAGIRSFPVVLMIYPMALITGEEITWHWVLLPIAMLLAVLFGVSVGLMISRLLARIPDLVQTIPLVLRLLFFTSGIFFSVEQRFDTAPALIQSIALNSPTALLLNTTRSIFLDDIAPSSTQLVILLSVTLLMLLFGLIVYWRSEQRNV